MGDDDDTVDAPYSTDGEPPESTVPAPSERQSALRHLNVASTIVVLSLPAAASIWLIHNYAVNVIYADQWYDIKLIRRPFSGSLGLTSLWSTHNESRIFFQNLSTLLLAHTTGYNVVVGDYLNAILLIIATALLIITHHRRSPLQHVILYAPVAIVMLSLVQWDTILFAFQIGYSITILALAVVIFLLDRPIVTNRAVFVAEVFAVVGSYSSIQGLFIWLVALVLLYHRRRTHSLLLIWFGCASATAGVYFYNWTAEGGTSVSYILTHPLAALDFFFFAVGDVIGIRTSTSGTRNHAVELTGVVIVAVGIWALLAYGLRQDEKSGRPIGISLVLFGLLFALSVTAERASGGLTFADQSRYTTFDLLILVGSYLFVVSQTKAHRAQRRSLAHSALQASVFAVICLQVIVGTSHGLADAQGYHQFQLTGADVLVNINRAPDGLVESALGSGFESVAFIRQMAAVAKEDHLALFATSSVGFYKSEGLVVSKTPPTTSVLRPTGGVSLNGVVKLVAEASDIWGVSRVEFQYAGEGMPYTTIDVAVSSSYVWLGTWNTSIIPDGIYTVRSVAYAPTGLVAYSAGVTVNVRN
jgi:Bacterial Ig domain